MSSKDINERIKSRTEGSSGWGVVVVVVWGVGGDDVWFRLAEKVQNNLFLHPTTSPHCRKKAKAAMLKASRKGLGGQHQMMAEDFHVISAKGMGIIARCVMRKIAT